MKKKKTVQRFLAAILMCIMLVSSVNVFPVSAKETKTETRTENLFTATFDQNSSDLISDDGFTGNYGYGDDKFDAFTYDGYLYLKSQSNWGQRRLWKSIDIPKGETLTIEFEMKSSSTGVDAFNVGIKDYEENGYQESTKLYVGKPKAWTKVKIEIQYNEDGSAVFTTYTKEMDDENAQYVAVSGYEDMNVAKDYAVDGMTNIYFYVEGTGGTVTIDNLSIYKNYETTLAKKSQFAAAFDRNPSDLISDDGFTGNYGYGDDKFDAFTDNGYLYLKSQSNWGQRRLWKSIDIPKGETLTIEFEMKSSSTGVDAFNVGIKDYEENGYQESTKLYVGKPKAWTKVKIEIQYNEDGSAVFTTYTKEMDDENAQYVAVSGYEDMNVAKDYAVDGMTNIYFYVEGTGGIVTIDNLDIYSWHEYQNGKCVVCGDYKDDTASLAGYSLILREGTIGLNYHMDMSEKVAEKSKTEVRFTVNGKTQTMTYDKSKEVGECRVFTCEVAAKQMTDKITAVMYNDGVAGTTYTYSVKEYADRILADSTTYAKEIPLVQAMLNYGTYAQEYFGYHTDKPANGGTYLGNTALSTVTADSLAQYCQSVKTGNDSVKLTSASLVLDGKTALRLYLEVADGMTVEGLQQSQYGCYIETKDILPQNLVNDMTMEVAYGNDKMVEISYNCMAYCYNVLKSDTTKEPLRNVVSALYLYSQSAIAYAGQ